MRIDILDDPRNVTFSYNAREASCVGRVRLVLQREYEDGTVDKVQDIWLDANKIDFNRICIVLFARSERQ